MPRSYNAQPPHPPPGYNGGWQYTDQSAEEARRRSGAPQSDMVPVPQNMSAEIVQAGSRHTSEQYHYQQYGQPQARPESQVSPPQVEEVAVPVMLCHTCSHCGTMRSAGYHRNNPVLPGKPLVSSPCRRCKKKIKYRSGSSFARIRSCTANEHCDWPDESFHIDINRGERRGRRRSREEIYVSRSSPSRPCVVRQSSSKTNLGLRVLQEPIRAVKTHTRMRVSSLSPRQSSRYGEVWPPPDVVRMRAAGHDEVPSPLPPPYGYTGRTEVWPPPDVVRTHPYRKLERSPSHRVSPRIVELSPSPPPVRTRATRVVYRSASRERHASSKAIEVSQSPPHLRTRATRSMYRSVSPEHRHIPRSISPVRVNIREKRRSEDAEARITAHPRPYRPVLPDQRPIMRTSDETSSNNESISRSRADSPGRSILKNVGNDRETQQRRQANMRASQQSTHVEVGGPRVHFTAKRKHDRPATESQGRTMYVDERPVKLDNFEHYRDYSQHQYVDKASRMTPADELEKLRIRRSSISPQRSYEEEIRIDRARRISPSPPPPRRYEETRVRYTSPLTSRARPLRGPPSPSLPERSLHGGYRHVSRTRTVERERPRTSPPPPRRLQEEVQGDETDSDSAQSGEIIETKSYKGIDENGQPATFVEERRSVRMIDQGSERLGDFRPMTDKLGTRSYRDV